MAFLAPLLAGAIPGLFQGISSLIHGKGGRTRRLTAPHRRMIGMGLPVLAKWPLLARPSQYAHGGAYRRRRGGSFFGRIKGFFQRVAPKVLSVLKPAVQAAAPILLPKIAAAVGTKLPQFASAAQSASNLALSKLGTAQAGLPAQLATGVANAIANKIGSGGRLGHLVRAHMSHDRYGNPIHVKSYRTHGMGGLLFPAGGAMKAPHYVRPHISHTRYGMPVHVRGHARGMGGLLAY